MDIDQNRRDTAEYILENFDFSYNVEASQGWSTDGLNEWSKVMYFEDPEDINADTIMGVFTITFEPGTSHPLDASCNVRGEVVGNIMGGTLSDYVVEEGAVLHP